MFRIFRDKGFTSMLRCCSLRLWRGVARGRARERLAADINRENLCSGCSWWGEKVFLSLGLTELYIREKGASNIRGTGEEARVYKNSLPSSLTRVCTRKHAVSFCFAPLFSALFYTTLTAVRLTPVVCSLPSASLPLEFFSRSLELASFSCLISRSFSCNSTFLRFALPLALKKERVGSRTRFPSVSLSSPSLFLLVSPSHLGQAFQRSKERKENFLKPQVCALEKRAQTVYTPRFVRHFGLVLQETYRDNGTF